MVSLVLAEEGLRGEADALVVPGGGHLEAEGTHGFVDGEEVDGRGVDEGSVAVEDDGGEGFGVGIFEGEG